MRNRWGYLAGGPSKPRALAFRVAAAYRYDKTVNEIAKAGGIARRRVELTLDEARKRWGDDVEPVEGVQ